MAVELIDELEAGELSVELEGEEPQVVLEWALERFAPRIAISTAFQVDGIAVLDMAYAIDPEIQVFSVDTGRLPQETLELVDALRERYPGLNLELLSPNPTHVATMVARHGQDLFYDAVDKRLLCCQVRKVLPLTRHLASLDAWITGLRRDQWATRTNIRKVEIDHDHGAIMKLNPSAPVTQFVGTWAHTAEMRATGRMPIALAQMGLLPLGRGGLQHTLATGADEVGCKSTDYAHHSMLGCHVAGQVKEPAFRGG